MPIRRSRYFIFALLTVGLTGFFIYLHNEPMFHISFALAVFLCIRIVFNKANVILIGFTAFIILVTLTLFAAFGSLFLAMTTELDELYYINHTVSYISSLYYFKESNIYTYIAAILGISCLELVLKPKMKVKQFVMPFFLACLLFFVSGMVFDRTVKTVRYEFQSDKLTGDSEIRIVHLSDTHSTIYPENQLVEKIKEQNPDLILMTGDIADDIMPFEGIEILLKQIQGVAPIYYVTGNHEYAAADFWETNQRIQSYGVRYLDDAYEMIDIKGNQLLIAGVDGPLSSRVNQPYEKMPQRLQTLADQHEGAGFEGIKILLSHRPELHEMYAVHDYDFVLTGHAMVDRYAYLIY